MLNVQVCGSNIYVLVEREGRWGMCAEQQHWVEKKCGEARLMNCWYDVALWTLGGKEWKMLHAWRMGDLRWCFGVGKWDGEDPN